MLENSLCCERPLKSLNPPGKDPLGTPGERAQCHLRSNAWPSLGSHALAMVLRPLERR